VLTETLLGPSLAQQFGAPAFCGVADRGVTDSLFVAIAWCEATRRRRSAFVLMGLYTKYVLPRLIDLAMRNKDAARLRASWIPRARGNVLEVGVGSGLNLPFYSAEVRQIWGVDPSGELQRMAGKRAVDSPIPVEFLSQSAEEPLAIADESIDTVVVTWTLCSIPNAAKALEQMRRVLKGDGRLIFIEHGRVPDPGVALWQDRLTPVWRRLFGGCRLNRKVDELIVAAGFQILELKTCYLPGPRLTTYTYQGCAQRT
jgi:ubiquinone/menaquinone biosynthesis C-methylase UbiE